MNVAPHAESRRLARAIRRLVDEGNVLESWNGTCFRTIRPRYWSQVLSGAGTLRHGSRWIAPLVAPAVYLATTPENAVTESLSRSRRSGIPAWQAMPLAIRGIKVRVGRALDLTLGVTRQRIRFSRARMTAGGWALANANGQEAATQALGRAAFEAGIEALLVPSSVIEAGTNVVVFPEALAETSHLKAL